MVDDLLFHIVTKEDWEKHKEYGNYIPQSLEAEGFIHCSKGKQVAKVANRKFGGETGLLLLVVDRASVKSSVKYEKDEESGEEFPHIYGPLNIDAVIDKIKLQPNDEGLFEIEFEEG